MEIQNQKIRLLYQSWESLKAAHDDLDKSKHKLEKAEIEMESVMYLLEKEDGSASKV